MGVDNAIASAGFYTLNWKSDQHDIVLQESTSVDFAHASEIYTGQDTATVISGKPNGDWFYRIRYVDDPGVMTWSEPLKISVQHHSLTRALLFLGIGIIVFLATTFMIVRGTGKIK